MLDYLPSHILSTIWKETVSPKDMSNLMLVNKEYYDYWKKEMIEWYHKYIQKTFPELHQRWISHNIDTKSMYNDMGIHFDHLITFLNNDTRTCVKMSVAEKMVTICTENETIHCNESVIFVVLFTILDYIREQKRGSDDRYTRFKKQALETVLLYTQIYEFIRKIYLYKKSSPYNNYLFKICVLDNIDYIQYHLETWRSVMPVHLCYRLLRLTQIVGQMIVRSIHTY